MKVVELMEGLFDRFKQKAEPQKPPRFPDRNDIDGWMTQQVEYYKQAHPDSVWRLFCPSMGDYLPQAVHAGVSREAFAQHINTYRDLKHQNPEAVKKALSQVVDYNIYRHGPSEDYPK